VSKILRQKAGGEGLGEDVLFADSQFMNAHFSCALAVLVEPGEWVCLTRSMASPGGLSALIRLDGAIPAAARVAPATEKPQPENGLRLWGATV
jgi:hypothetical protein